MGKKEKSKKQDKLFWTGLGIGVLGGVAGSMAITSMYRMLDFYGIKGYPAVEFTISLITLASVVLLCFYMIRK